MIWYLELSKNKTYFSHICSYNCNVLFIMSTNSKTYYLVIFIK